MKKTSTIFTAVLMTAMILTSCGGGGSKNEYHCDTLKVYEKEVNLFDEVTIGKQVWMTQNLDVDKFLNGDAIPEAKTNGEWSAYRQAGEAAWCYYNNDPKPGEKYGKLYNWYAVIDPRGLAPKGWHIPTDTEWTVLTDYLGGAERAGAKMKLKEGNGTNSSGFSGLLGGIRTFDGNFRQIDRLGMWWSSTTGKTYLAWIRYITDDKGNVKRDIWDESVGFSVRCIKD